MSMKIPQEKWTKFFEDLSKRRFAWETKISVANDDTGRQVLSSGLYLNGVTFEERSGTTEIEISVSKNKTDHMSHTIAEPVTVTFLGEDKFHDAQVEIAEANGTLTVIRILNPMPIMVGYAAYKAFTV